METTLFPKINQSDFNEFLEWKRLNDQGTSATDLTIPPLAVHNPLCVRKQQEEGLCMVGSIRAATKNNKCPECGEKFIDTGNQLICSSCRMKPDKFLTDLHWQGKRVRLFKDRSGETLDSYNRAKRLLERIRGEIDDKSFDPTFYTKADKRKFQFDRYVWHWFDMIKDDLAPATNNKRS